MKKFFFLILFLASPLVAGEKISREQTKQIMQLSGAYNATMQIISALTDGFKTIQSRVPPALWSDFEKGYKKGFDRNLLQQSLENSFQNNFNGAYTKKTLEWLNSPLGRKIAELEIRPNTHAATSKTKVAEKRQLLVKRMITASHIDESVAEMVFEIAKGMNATTKRLAGEDMTNFDQKSATMRDQMLKMFSGMLPGLLANIYAELKDDELTKYIEFWESPAGLNLSATMRKSTKAALDEANALAWSNVQPLGKKKFSKSGK